MPICIRKIQVRRRPKRSDEKVSTNGPDRPLERPRQVERADERADRRRPEAAAAHLRGDRGRGEAERDALGDVEQEERGEPAPCGSRAGRGGRCACGGTLAHAKIRGERICAGAAGRAGRASGAAHAQCRSRRLPLNAFGLMTLPSRSLAERRARRIASLVSRRARSSAAGQRTRAGCAAARALPLAQRCVDAGTAARPQDHAQQQQHAGDDDGGGEDLLDDVHLIPWAGSFAAIVARLDGTADDLVLRHPPTWVACDEAQNQGRTEPRAVRPLLRRCTRPMDEPDRPAASDGLPTTTRPGKRGSSPRPTTPRRSSPTLIDDAVPTPLLRDAADGRPRRLGRQHRRAAGASSPPTPADSGMVFVVVMHLSAEHESAARADPPARDHDAGAAGPRTGRRSRPTTSTSFRPARR